MVVLTSFANMLLMGWGLIIIPACCTHLPNSEAFLSAPLSSLLCLVNSYLYFRALSGMLDTPFCDSPKQNQRHFPWLPQHIFHIFYKELFTPQLDSLHVCLQAPQAVTDVWQIWENE